MPEQLSKPLDYYQVKVSTLLELALDNPECTLLVKIAKDLRSGASDIPQVQEIIDSSNDFREKKRKAGRKGGLAKASTAIASLENAKAKASSAKFCSSIVTVTGTVIEKKDLKDKDSVSADAYTPIPKAESTPSPPKRKSSAVDQRCKRFIRFLTLCNGIYQNPDGREVMRIVKRAVTHKEYKHHDDLAWYRMMIGGCLERKSADLESIKQCCRVKHLFMLKNVEGFLSDYCDNDKNDGHINEILKELTGEEQDASN